MKLKPAGEAAVIAYLGERNSPEVSARIQALEHALSEQLGDKLRDLIPSYVSLLVCFDPLKTDHYEVADCIRSCDSSLGDVSGSAGQLIELPVYYHPEAGADLETLAEQRSLSWSDIAAIHYQQEYRVYAIGFAPGFAYLGDVDERIAAPRLSTPRKQVPRGAVAIADRQTAIYPAESPGGWNLIGRSPLRMFDADAEEPMVVSVGDRIRFRPITRDEFVAAGGDLL